MAFMGYEKLVLSLIPFNMLRVIFIQFGFVEPSLFQLIGEEALGVQHGRV